MTNLWAVFCKDSLQKWYDVFVSLVITILRLNTCVQHSIEQHLADRQVDIFISIFY